MKKLSFLLAATALAAPALAQNDECTGAIPLAAGAPTAFDTAAATASAPAWPCAGGGGPDVWYSYTTSGIENIEVSTCDNATYDTAIEIFTGDCGNLVPLTCNDDGGGCSGFTSIAAASNIAAGTDLFIRIGGFSGAVGFGTVTLTSTPGGGGPANDECAGAIPLALGAPTAFDTTTASTSAPAWPCAAGGGSDIWFSYTTTSSDLVTVSTCDNATYDTAIEIFSGDCGNLVPVICNDDGAGCSGFTSTAIASGLTSGTDLFIRIGGYAGAAGTGTVTLTTSPDPCTTLTPDAFEDNDDCASAAALTPGNNPGLNCSISDSDFYSVTIPAGESIFVDCLHFVANGDLDVYIWDPSIACDSNIEGEGAPTALAQGFTGTDDEFVSYANQTGAPLDVIVEIDVWSGSVGLCSDYDLNVSTMVDPCQMADAFEENDDCSTAAPAVDGSYSLNVQPGDKDFFAVSVAAGDTIVIDVLHTAATGDLDAYLWDPLISCDSDIVGEGGDGTELALGFSGTDDELLDYTNFTGADQDLILEVRMWGGDASSCNTYTLNVAGSSVGGPGPIGTTYCSTNPNSTGNAADISGFGETRVSANDVTLTASNLPPNQFGIFIVSAAQGFVPNAGGTSNGNLCLGGAIGRYVGPGEILSAGAAGEFSLSVDLSVIPQGGGTTSTVAGDTWNFQAWYRDGVGLGSNFTSGLEILFN